MRNSVRKPTAIDLFCGCGGLTLAFTEANYNVILGIDTDDSALHTYEKDFGNTMTLNLDLSAAEALNRVHEAIGKREVDVIIAGPPCQGFSLTGPRKFDDARNRLYLSVIKAVQGLNPKSFIIENVPGLATLYNGQIKDEIVRRFTSLNYNVSYKILNAADFGVPQIRRRFFLVGLRPEFGHFEFPVPIHSPVNYTTCSDAISDLPSRENEPGKEVDIYDKEPNTQYQRMMRGDCSILYNHVATNHTEMVRNVIALVPEGGNYKDLPPGVGDSRRFHVAWTRYHSAKPCSTIDTGHRNHFHYKYNRIPTVRENARLQSFPDRFVFYGNRTQQNRHVGNAVPPLLGFHLAKEILKHIVPDKDYANRHRLAPTAIKNSQLSFKFRR